MYDNAGRVTSSVEKNAKGVIITGFEYTYDILGRIATEKRLDKNLEICYTYDRLSRVTLRTVTDLATCNSSQETFNYDSAGNILYSATNSDYSAYTYDKNNRLISYNGTDVTYDADGNMTSAYLDCTGELFRYDSTNRLVGTNTNAYTYNAENVRIRNLCGDSETTYVYDSNAKLSRLLVKTTDGRVTKYVYGRGIIGEETSGVFKTYHFDYRGSTVAITDINGNITDRFEYDTYGKLTSRTGTSDIIFLYNGRDGVVTDGNGLIYMRARYYAPELRRFINADILSGDIANGITLNRYAYANANPVSMIDPKGLASDNRWNEDDLNHTWEELGFVYDDSKCDIARLEQGLPPYAYEQWLKEGYGYSDDPYWDAILGNSDAFYVVDYDYAESGGLPVVAHAYLLLKDSNGDWIKTEFGGSKLSNAKIRYYTISSDKVVNALSAPLENIEYTKEEPHIEWVFGFIPIIVTTTCIDYIHVGGVQYVPIKGDFSKSIEMAYNESGGNYGGYSLLNNNCLHYARDVLRAGDASSSGVENVIERSRTIVPDEFYDQLYSATP